MFGLRNFLHGFRYPFAAIFFILRAPSVLALVSIPLLISLGISVFFFVYVDGIASLYVQQAALWMSSQVPSGLATVATWLLRGAAWVSLFVVSSLAFTVVGGILASPFSDWLSRRVMQVRRKKGQSAPLPALRSEGDGALSIVDVITLEFKRTLILIFVGCFALLLGLIPFMQIPALILGSGAVAFEYLGFPISQRDPRLSAIAAYMLRNPARSLGLGVGVLVLMAIPFAGVFTIPLAVVGATLAHDEAFLTRR